LKNLGKIPEIFCTILDNKWKISAKISGNNRKQALFPKRRSKGRFSPREKIRKKRSAFPPWYIWVSVRKSSKCCLYLGVAYGNNCFYLGGVYILRWDAPPRFPPPYTTIPVLPVRETVPREPVTTVGRAGRPGAGPRCTVSHESDTFAHRASHGLIAIGWRMSERWKGAPGRGHRLRWRWAGSASAPSVVSWPSAWTPGRSRRRCHLRERKRGWEGAS